MLILISAVCNFFLPLFPCCIYFLTTLFSGTLYGTIVACLPACLLNTDVFEIFGEKNLASLQSVPLFYRYLENWINTLL